MTASFAPLNDAVLHALRCREIAYRRARRLAALVPPSGRVLEVGAGFGAFLGQMARLRPDAALHAVAADARLPMAALDGAEIRILEWAALEQTAPFDLIVFFQTSDQPALSAESARRLAARLNLDGRLVIELPLTAPSSPAGPPPRPTLADAAALPGHAWFEMGRDEAAPHLPDPAVVAATPCRRAVPGRLRRWLQGPARDHSLAEPEGRLFRWGLPVDPVSMAGLLKRAEQAMDGGAAIRVADLNVAKVIALLQDAPFRQAVLSADLAVADGMGVVWGMRALGVPVPERVSGIDLLDAAAGLCRQRSFRPYVVGARRDVVDRAVERLCHRHPGLRLAGWRDGYFPATEDEAVAAHIRSTGADCLIAALPYPRQDLFLARVQPLSNVRFAFGVGGSLDVLAGDRRRAPPWVQAAGMEWLYRLSQEPARLGPRYLSTNSRFLIALASYWLAQRLGGDASD